MIIKATIVGSIILSINIKEAIYTDPKVTIEPDVMAKTKVKRKNRYSLGAYKIATKNIVAQRVPLTNIIHK